MKYLFRGNKKPTKYWLNKSSFLIKQSYFLNNSSVLVMGIQGGRRSFFSFFLVGLMGLGLD
jgi:hypothetical protein